MIYRILRSADSDRDLDLIFDHLVQSYLTLGDVLPDAFERAAQRLRTIETDMMSLAQAPHQGTLRPEIASGLRQVTKNRAIFYFDIDASSKSIRVLAIFFGGQDHQRHMAKRLSLGEQAPDIGANDDS